MILCCTFFTKKCIFKKYKVFFNVNKKSQKNQCSLRQRLANFGIILIKKIKNNLKLTILIITKSEIPITSYRYYFRDVAIQAAVFL